VPRALKVIMGSLQPKCKESIELRKCAEAVLKKFKMREMVQDSEEMDGGTRWAQDAARWVAMERGAKEACARATGLEEQAEQLRKEGRDARNAYQQQRAFIQSQLGEGADPTKVHDFLKGLVDSMDAQFGIMDPPRAAGSSYSPGSSLARGGGRSRQEERKTGGEDREDRDRDKGSRSPRLDREGGSNTTVVR
jgi:hypothetical protein